VQHAFALRANRRLRSFAGCLMFIIHCSKFNYLHVFPHNHIPAGRTCLKHKSPGTMSTLMRAALHACCFRHAVTLIAIALHVAICSGSPLTPPSTPTPSTCTRRSQKSRSF
jgi:hypothetical protein